MDRLPPIPTPSTQLWREFKVRVLPPLFFVAVATAVVLLWRQNVAAPSLVGEVEKIHANVSSPKAGKLSQLTVSRLQHVKSGDIIAQVITTDPQILQSSLAVIQAEIRLLRVNLHPLLGQQRYALNFDHLRLDWMDQRVQLATAKVRLELAEVELRRDQELMKDRIISQQAVDAALSARDGLQAEVKERTNLVAELEEKLKTLKLGQDHPSLPQDATPDDVLQASIKVQEEKLRLTEAELSPITLTVPMDGTVTAILHRSGEAVNAGEPIVTVTALSSDRILSYVRQPISFEPKVGMKVEVRARSLQRCVAEARVIEVGSQMEPIHPPLSSLSSEHFHEVGLPVLVSLPNAQKLIPGELVDLRILSGSGDPVATPVEDVRVH